MKEEIYIKALILTLNETERYLEDCLFLAEYIKKKEEIIPLLTEIGKIIEEAKQLLEEEE